MQIPEIRQLQGLYGLGWPQQQSQEGRVVIRLEHLHGPDSPAL